MFKQTNFPGHWQTTPLSILIEDGVLWAQSGFAQGGFNEDGDGVPHIRPFNVTEDGEISLEQIKYVPPPPKDGSFWLQPGDVIFNNTNSEDLVGKTAYFNLGGQFVYSNHMTALRMLEPDIVDAYWLARYLHYLWQSGKFKMLCRRYVGQASVSLQKLKTVELWLPPLAEQQAITAVLRTAQDAISARQQEAALERERKAALMQHLFTYGTRGEELKETEYGRVPQSWQIVNLETVIKDGKAQNGAFVKNPEWGTGVPFVNVADIYKDVVVDITSVEKLRCDDTFLVRYGLQTGDLLFVRSSLKREGVGHCCLVDMLPEPAIYDCHLIKVSPNQTLADPRFLAYFFLSHSGKNSLIMRSKTTTMTTINQKGLVKSLVPKPSLKEQSAIADALSACDDKITALEKEITTLNELFQTLLEQLMTGQLSARALISMHEPVT